MSVTFIHHSDAMDVLKNKRYLPEYKRKCRMEEDHLIIKGKTFTRDNISDLPEEISAFRVTGKEDDTTVGFFGELNPLSNFH